MSIDVSIIITAYNIESYIARAIHSALEQRGVSVEVIFVDDCSTDKTFSVASAIQDPRLTCLRLPVNSGPGGARNAGFEKAAGKWIAVLDGDDAYEPERLANCLSTANRTGADVVVDNLRVIREQDGAQFPMFPSDFLRKTTLGLADFIAGNTAFFGSYSLGYLKPVFAADFLRGHGIAYDPGIRIGEDYLILCEALASGAVCAIEPSAGYLYTARAGSISYRLAPADLDRMAACDRKFLSRHTLSPVAAQAQKKRDFNIREARAFTLLVDGLKRKDPLSALTAFLSCPSAARHLSGAVMVRMHKLIPSLSGKKS
ncbi:MAG: glycosyl transferase [Micavibrio sp.]|nr:glycosyl transferase [Micavibrio sp.]